MDKSGILLIVDDNKAILISLELLLKKYFEQVICISSPNLINTKLRENAVDVILLDMNFTSSINTGNEGIFWLNNIKEFNPDIQVVLFTAYVDIRLAVKGIKQGATDFVVKPWDNKKLIDTLQNAYVLRKQKSDAQNLRSLKPELPSEPVMVWGESEAMAQLKKTIEKVATTDTNILITGENGTGKEVLAREIHRLSNRHSKVMVSVDMGSVTETLFESELFGHVKGAFTDAYADRVGKFENADGGTLFLDEIGNIPYHLQSKLLTVIQNQSVVRVGSNQQIPINIRLLCATNKDIHKMVQEGTFREDLLYRINTIHVEIPPLRKRKEDILPMANLFLNEFDEKYNKKIRGFDKRAEKELVEYVWNGNIRELKHTIEKAVILCEKSVIDSGSLLLNQTAKTSKVETFSSLEEMEKEMIEKSIQKHNGNLTLVAQQLGISRQTLYNKLKRYGL